jgi:hypothetical protein
MLVISCSLISFLCFVLRMNPEWNPALAGGIVNLSFLRGVLGITGERGPQLVARSHAFLCTMSLRQWYLVYYVDPDNR